MQNSCRYIQPDLAILKDLRRAKVSKVYGISHLQIGHDVSVLIYIQFSPHLLDYINTYWQAFERYMPWKRS